MSRFKTQGTTLHVRAKQTDILLNRPKSRTQTRSLPTKAASITHISRLKAVLLSGNRCREADVARQGSIFHVHLTSPHHSIKLPNSSIRHNKPVYLDTNSNRQRIRKNNHQGLGTRKKSLRHKNRKSSLYDKVREGHDFQKRRLACNESRLIFDSCVTVSVRPCFQKKSSREKRFLVWFVKGA